MPAFHSAARHARRDNTGPSKRASFSDTLRTVPSIEALAGPFGNGPELRAAIEHYGTWAALTRAIRTRDPKLGGVHGQIPPTPPALRQLAPGVYRIPWYAPQYPSILAGETSSPALLYQRGRHLPTAVAVGIGGADDPSPQGIEVARSAALAAVSTGAAVAVELAGGAAGVAMRSALAAGGQVIAILPAGMDTIGLFERDIDDVLAAGGAVVTQVLPGAPADRDASASLLAALSATVVLAEVGRGEIAGAAVARHAIAAGRSLVAPASQFRHIPASAAGLEILTKPGAFSDEWYGSNDHIAERVGQLLPAVDVVVATQREIRVAIRDLLQAASQGQRR